MELINFTTVPSHADQGQTMSMGGGYIRPHTAGAKGKSSESSNENRTASVHYRIRPLLYVHSPRATTLYGTLISYLVIAAHVYKPVSMYTHIIVGTGGTVPIVCTPCGAVPESLSPIHHPQARWAEGIGETPSEQIGATNQPRGNTEQCMHITYRIGICLKFFSLTSCPNRVVHLFVVPAGTIVVYQALIAFGMRTGFVLISIAKRSDEGDFVMPRKAGVARRGDGSASTSAWPLRVRGANCQHHGAAPAIIHYCTTLLDLLLRRLPSPRRRRPLTADDSTSPAHS